MQKTFRKSHGDTILEFEETDQTLGEFIRCFRLGRHRPLLEKDQSLHVVLGEVMYDKNGYTMRRVFVGDEELINFRFLKKELDEPFHPDSEGLILAIGNRDASKTF